MLRLLRAVTRQRSLTTLVVPHDPNAAARHADRVALLDGGRLIEAGGPAEVLRASVIGAVFGVAVAVLDGPDGRPVVVPLSA